MCVQPALGGEATGGHGASRWWNIVPRLLVAAGYRIAAVGGAIGCGSAVGWARPNGSFCAACALVNGRSRALCCPGNAVLAGLLPYRCSPLVR